MKSFLLKHFDFSDPEFDLLMANAKVMYFKKHELLFQADRPVEKLFFIKSGLMRGYRLLNGEEVTHHFFLENGFATDYESYLTGRTGELYLETLTEVVAYEFNKTNLSEFYIAHPKFEKMRVIQAEDAYLQMIKRIKTFQTKELKERFIELICKSPELFKKVPQKYIASYLGVAPQSLSRIKSSLKEL